MAVVNPQIQPTNDPNYGANSRAIDTPDPIRRQGVQQNQILPEGQKVGDRSAEYEGQAAGYGMQAEAVANKGFGDLFAGIVGIGDFLGKAGVQLVRKDIENKVYEVADRERQNYTAELERIKAGGTKNILDANASMDEPVPSEIEDLPDTLATLQAARDGGRITKTDYQGRLLAEAKRLRAMHPGFKKEIDDEFAKVTGQNPANARINNLITDINRTAAQNASQDKFIDRTYLSNKEVPRADEFYAKRKAGLISDSEFFGHFSKYAQAKEKLVLRGMINNDIKMTREEAERKGKEDADMAGGLIVASVAEGLLGKLGLNSPSDVENLDGQQKAGTLPATKWAELNQETANTITKLRVQMANDMDKTGTTKRLGGVEERNKRIEEYLKPLNTIHDRIINKDFGGIYSASKEATTRVDDAKVSLLRDSKAGPIFASQAAIKDLGGEQYLQRFNLEQALGKNGIPAAYSEWYKRWTGHINSQAGNPNAAAVTFNDFFNEAKTKGVNDPKVNAALIKEVDKIGSSNVPDGVKESIAMAAFSPGNRGFISRLNPDGIDSKGRPISGMNAAFQRWTSPEHTMEMKRLGEKNPALWENYKTWAKDTFGNELLQRELNDLAKYNKDPNISIQWDVDNKRFNVSRTDMASREMRSIEAAGGTGYNTSEAIARQKQFETISRSVNRINSGLYNLKNIAKEGGENIDAFLINTIREYGGKETTMNVSGIPWSMLNQIVIGNANANRRR